VFCALLFICFMSLEVIKDARNNPNSSGENGRDPATQCFHCTFYPCITSTLLHRKTVGRCNWNCFWRGFAAHLRPNLLCG